ARAPHDFRLRLPATSANLGPGFDAIGLALTLSLEIEATRAEAFSLIASGRDKDICSSMTDNLLLKTYSQTLTANGVLDPLPLTLEVRNGIPLGMGCGSSAAARLGGVALAAHFGGLGWDRDRILTEASILEGHPDNTAACWLGGFAAATIASGRVYAASIKPTVDWRILLALPRQPLATARARAVLPSTYSSADAVANVQRASLLTAAFALGRGDLLRVAMQDKMHQPYRDEMCPMLSFLLPLAGEDGSPGMDGLMGMALSGAGPAVLLLVESAAHVAEIKRVVDGLTWIPGGRPQVEFIECGINNTGASY
ncbi:MAG TPA: homoserine kinase, partial [Acidisarcina sp.]